MEADLLQEYGLNLVDLWRDDRPDVTFRRVATLAAHLKPGSRLAAARMSDDAWSGEQYMLAAVFDAVMDNTWVTANHGVERHKQSSRPDPLHRPADERSSRERAELQVERALAFRERMRSRVELPTEGDDPVSPLA